MKSFETLAKAPLVCGTVSLGLCLLYLLERSGPAAIHFSGRTLDTIGIMAFCASVAGVVLGALTYHRKPVTPVRKWGLALCIAALLLSGLGLPL
ncbi:MAG TPA: hypothetical protein VLT36_23540 [Candidatus Dormibacteraeota bacterium]|nr:hypothetical protein [Candidatus Dormibacteraeota bacterium]